MTAIDNLLNYLKHFPETLGSLVVRRAWWMIVIALVITAALVPGTTMMETDSSISTLISPKSQVFLDNERHEQHFGRTPMTVLLTGELDDIFSTDNLATIDLFDQHFSADPRYRFIVSPLLALREAEEEATRTIQALNDEISEAQEAAAMEAREAAIAQGLSPEEQDQAAEAARAQVLEGYRPQLDLLQQIGEPSLKNPAFTAMVLYDEDGSVRPEMASLIPDNRHAIIVVTPEGNIEGDKALQVILDVEEFFQSNPLKNVEIMVVGDAKVMDAIGESIGSNMMFLLGLSIVVMLVFLLLLFRVRWRLLSLLMVGLGALWTFGIMGYASVPLSMATMTVLPVLIGLGIDYSIQFHNRYQEEIIRRPSVARAVIITVTRMFPVVGIALLATIIGFITLYISEVPMVRDFGLILAVGIVLSYIVALFLLHSIVYLSDRKMPVERLGKAAAEASGRIERVLARAARTSLKYPLPIFLIALIFGLTGAVADRWLPTNTDYQEFLPQNIPELQETRHLNDIVGHGVPGRTDIAAYGPDHRNQPGIAHQ